MSAAKSITITCDHPYCGRWVPQGRGDTAEEARKGLAHMGWALAAPGGTDYCPEHAYIAKRG